MFTCKDCKDREVGCHSRCEKYKREKTKHERLKAINESDKDYRAYRREQRDKRIKANAKRKNKHHEYFRY